MQIVSLSDVLQADAGSFGAGWTGLTTAAGQKQVLVAGSGSGSSVTVADGTWSYGGVASNNGVDYVVYNDDTNTAQLIVDSHLARYGVIG